MRDKITGFKAIKKDKLIEILNQLPDNTLISPNGVGNMSVYIGEWPNEGNYGCINLMRDELEIYDPGLAEGLDERDAIEGDTLWRKLHG